MVFRESYDALVVGARCAGAATAMLMARRGLRVLAIDRAAYGADTVSTHALMRGGVLQLSRWGVLPAVREMGTPAVRSTSFHYADEVLDIAIQPSDGVDALYAPRRTLLDSLLVDAAREAGAAIRHAHTLADLIRRPDGRVCGATIIDAEGNAIAVGAELVIGADGIGSKVARLSGAQTVREARSATAVAFGYISGIGLTGYHWYFRAGVTAGVIPTNAGQHCVFVSIPPERFRSGAWRSARWAEYRHALADIAPDVAAAIPPGASAEPLRIFAGHKGFFRQAHGPGWALVGDAGYFKDPVTAHGITDAFRDAELLADAAAAGTVSALADYAATRDALSVPLFDVTERIASFDWDADEIKALHRGLNRAMKEEVAYLEARGSADGSVSVQTASLAREEVS